MATLKNDFIRLHLASGVVNIKCLALGIEWPPPERLYISKDEALLSPEKGGHNNQNILFRKTSSAYDEEADNPYIARGAEYFYLKEEAH